MPPYKDIPLENPNRPTQSGSSQGYPTAIYLPIPLEFLQLYQWCPLSQKDPACLLSGSMWLCPLTLHGGLGFSAVSDYLRTELFRQGRAGGKNEYIYSFIFYIK